MPVIIRHRCGKVLYASKELPSEDDIRRIHRRNDNRCPGCGGELAWSPMKVDVKIFKQKRG